VSWQPPDPLPATDWRRRAEELLSAAEGPQAADPPSEMEAARVLHELRVHQLEMEMQNEALREAQLEAEAGWERFQELYDGSPAGHFSMDAQGILLELNLAAAHLLGGERASLLNRCLYPLLQAPDRDRLAGFLRQGLEDREPPACELTLPGPGPGIRVGLRGAPSVDGKVLQVAAMAGLPDHPERTGPVPERLLDQLEASLVELEDCGRMLRQPPPVEDRLASVASAVDACGRRLRILQDQLKGKPGPG